MGPQNNNHNRHLHQVGCNILFCFVSRLQANPFCRVQIPFTSGKKRSSNAATLIAHVETFKDVVRGVTELRVIEKHDGTITFAVFLTSSAFQPANFFVLKEREPQKGRRAYNLHSREFIIRRVRLYTSRSAGCCFLPIEDRISHPSLSYVILLFST